MGHKGVDTEARKARDLLYIKGRLRIINVIRAYGRGEELKLTQQEFGDEDRWGALRTGRGREVVVAWVDKSERVLTALDASGYLLSITNLRHTEQAMATVNHVLGLLGKMLDDIPRQK